MKGEKRKRGGKRERKGWKRRKGNRKGGRKRGDRSLHMPHHFMSLGLNVFCKGREMRLAEKKNKR
jgi:hypothetical protein